MLRRRRAAKTAHAVPPHAQFEKDDAARIKKSLRDPPLLGINVGALIREDGGCHIRFLDANLIRWHM